MLELPQTYINKSWEKSNVKSFYINGLILVVIQPEVSLQWRKMTKSNNK